MPEDVKMKKRHKSINLSFAGCGFLGAYHIGVATAFRKFGQAHLLDYVSGCSAGSIIAACIIGEVEADRMIELLGAAARNLLQTTKTSLSPRPIVAACWNIPDTIRASLMQILPDDIHERASGRLYISLTSVYSFSNEVVYEYNTKEEVIDAVICSSFIPFYEGLLYPRFKGRPCIDGGFTNNMVKLNPKTISVSPIAGCADISPERTQGDTGHGLLIAGQVHEISVRNFSKTFYVTMPPNDEQIYQLVADGVTDGLNFLIKHDLVPTRNRLLSIEATYKPHHHAQSWDALRNILPSRVIDYLYRMDRDHVATPLKILSHLVDGTPLDRLTPVVSSLWRYVAVPGWQYSTFLYESFTGRRFPDIEKLIDNGMQFVTKTVIGGSVVKLSEVNRVPCADCHQMWIRCKCDDSTSSAEFEADINIRHVEDIRDIRHVDESMDTDEDANDREFVNIHVKSHILHDQEVKVPSGTPNLLAFQHQNLAAAIHTPVSGSRASSTTVSRNVSRAASLVASQAPSRAESITGSRATSRRGSIAHMDLEVGYAGDESHTFEYLVNVTAQNNPVINLAYQRDDGQVVTLSMFDIPDTQGDALIADLVHSRAPGEEGVPSTSAGLPRLQSREDLDNELRRKLSMLSMSMRDDDHSDNDDGEQTEDSFSDPEADWNRRVEERKSTEGLQLMSDNGEQSKNIPEEPSGSLPTNAKY